MRQLVSACSECNVGTIGKAGNERGLLKIHIYINFKTSKL